MILNIKKSHRKRKVNKFTYFNENIYFIVSVPNDCC